MNINSLMLFRIWWASNYCQLADAYTFQSFPLFNFQSDASKRKKSWEYQKTFFCIFALEMIKIETNTSQNMMFKIKENVNVFGNTIWKWSKSREKYNKFSFLHFSKGKKYQTFKWYCDQIQRKHVPKLNWIQIRKYIVRYKIKPTIDITSLCLLTQKLMKTKLCAIRQQTVYYDIFKTNSTITSWKVVDCIQNENVLKEASNALKMYWEFCI